MITCILTGEPFEKKDCQDKPPKKEPEKLILAGKYVSLFFEKRDNLKPGPVRANNFSDEALLYWFLSSGRRIVDREDPSQRLGCSRRRSGGDLQSRR